ncbi:MAG TPA: STAS domain-containing protein [Pyrinomonadaceae bacterium]|jgi:anti-anti-sigma factor|nr:STAS domain-containing protein [Pyrinomonadaceae bacterium]
MNNPLAGSPVNFARDAGAIAIVNAGDYVNKLSGERIERECRVKLEAGCRALVINFRNTELVNSIGVSILLGVIEAAERTGARLVFASVNRHTVKLFELLGLTRHVALAESEEDALATLAEFNTSHQGH